MTHPPTNGRRVSHYAVLRQLGHGNLTRVFLAAPRHGRPAELVVLKLLQSELAEDDDFRALFLDQAATTLALRHPNVVATHDVFAEPEACGLTLEFLEGQTLARVLERVGRLRFPVDLHLHVLSQVLGALEHAHTLGGLNAARADNVHRDVCPSNVFITYEGEVKLLGTGFADVTRALEGRLGRPLVDVRHAAPEVLLGRPAAPSADLFAVGTLLWEAIARQARSSGDAAVVIRKRTSGQEPDLESVWADAPQPLVELCTRALALDPSDRHPSAHALRIELDAYLGRSSETSDAVLGRLPGLMQSWFADERAQMQQFVRSSLELSQSSSESMSLPGVTDELAADDEEWTAQTSNTLARESAAGLDTVDAERVRPPWAAPHFGGDHGSPTRFEPIEQIEAPPSTRLPADSPRLGSSRAAERSEKVAASPPSARTSALDLPSPRESTTGGHRAYSTNLDTTRVSRGAYRWGPDGIGAAALLLGSLVAVYSLYRHSMRDEPSDSRALAVQAEARGVSRPAPLTAPARSPGEAARASVVGVSGFPPTPPARRSTVGGVLDAGTGEALRAPAPAFFEGEAATSPHAVETTPPLTADELPRVDPELSSLQDAILTSARAKRASRLRRDRDRAKKAETPPPRASTGFAQPRTIDDTDPNVGSSLE